MSYLPSKLMLVQDADGAGIAPRAVCDLWGGKTLSGCTDGLTDGVLMVLEDSRLEQITKLHQDAERAARLNQCGEAVGLLDQAIALSGNGVEMLVIQVIRDIFRSEQCASWQATILILHRQNELISQGKNNHVEMLEALIRLATLLIEVGDKRFAAESLTQANLLIAILRATEPSQIEQQFTLGYPLSAAQFLQLRANTLTRLQEQLRFG